MIELPVMTFPILYENEYMHIHTFHLYCCCCFSFYSLYYAMFVVYFSFGSILFFIFYFRIGISTSGSLNSIFYNMLVWHEMNKSKRTYSQHVYDMQFSVSLYFLLFFFIYSTTFFIKTQPHVFAIKHTMVT